MSDFPDDDLLIILLDSIYCEVQNSKVGKQYMDLGMYISKNDDS